MLAAIADFAGSATHWVDELNTAIAEREYHVLQVDDSAAAFSAAELALRDARAKVNRLQVLVPWQSAVGVQASAFVSALQISVEQLRDWPAQPDDEGDDEDEDDVYDDSDIPEDERYDPVMTPIEDTISEAVLWRDAALTAYREFTRAAAEETHRSGRGQNGRLRHSNSN